jgi:hypothetical protein
MHRGHQSVTNSRETGGSYCGNGRRMLLVISLAILPRVCLAKEQRQRGGVESMLVKCINAVETPGRLFAPHAREVYDS